LSSIISAGSTLTAALRGGRLAGAVDFVALVAFGSAPVGLGWALRGRVGAGRAVWSSMVAERSGRADLDESTRPYRRYLGDRHILHLRTPVPTTNTLA
jgi:hypothetical protein